jgi:hypothetical protein
VNSVNTASVAAGSWLPRKKHRIDPSALPPKSILLGTVLLTAFPLTALTGDRQPREVRSQLGIIGVPSEAWALLIRIWERGGSSTDPFGTPRPNTAHIPWLRGRRLSGFRKVTGLGERSESAPSTETLELIRGNVYNTDRPDVPREGSRTRCQASPRSRSVLYTSELLTLPTNMGKWAHEDHP